MNSQRLLVGTTVFNLLLVLFSLSRTPAVEADGSPPVLRGSGLQIVDDSGRIRASIAILPADPTVQMPDGSVGYPETVLLRLINSQGRPNVKIAATERGAALGLGGDSDPTYVQILAQGDSTVVKLTNKDGREQVIRP
jgi:hypothetical protein